MPIFGKKSKPLSGKVIVVTRAFSQASQLADGLKEQGAVVVEFPTIEIDLLITELPEAVVDVDWVVFTSANAVRGLKLSMEAADRPFEFSHAKVCSVGPGTERELKTEKVKVDLVPETYTAEAAFDALSNIVGDLSGQRFLLPQGSIARDALAKSLSEAGAGITPVVVYETICPEPDSERIQALINTEPDLITFTSGSTARNFVTLVDVDAFPNTTYASIGPHTTEVAESCGLSIIIQPNQHDIPGLINAITTHYA
ncbi:MAG: uroporphyrinogen-III synthase [Candidatus Hydrogenedentota bacterium]